MNTRSNNMRQGLHAILPEPSHDENARQEFVAAFRGFLTANVQPKLGAVYQQRVLPKLEKNLGRAPENSDEVRNGMTSEPLYQMWSAMQRRSQELVWNSSIDTIERTLPELTERVEAHATKGSLQLDPELEVPAYHTAYDIHLQPGGYHTERMEEDFVAGAIYDFGVPIYGGGMLGAYNDAVGHTLVKHYKSIRPDARPVRILDIGCAIGNSTLPWKEAYPNAEVHGVDVAAPCLRYGHARANALNAEIHFHQQNAEELDFEEGSFDVVAAGIVLHETSTRALPRILAEARRLLKPGGVMIMMDGFRPGKVTPINAFFQEWEIYNNNERFLKTLINTDILAVCHDAGFETGKVGYEDAIFVTGSEANSSEDQGYMTGFNKIPLLVGYA